MHTPKKVCSAEKKWPAVSVDMKGVSRNSKKI